MTRFGMNVLHVHTDARLTKTDDADYLHVIRQLERCRGMQNKSHDQKERPTYFSF